MLRWILNIVYALVSVAAVVGAAVWSWREAAPEANAPPQRLRWFVTTNARIHAGTLLAKDDLQLQLARMPDGPDYIRTVEQAVGRFVATPIDADTALTEQMIASRSSIAVPDGGSVVAVEVASDHSAALMPGMRLAFANDKALIPTAADLAKKTPEPAFTLLAIGPSSRKPEVTSLLVAVPRTQMQHAGVLGSGAWRPVILAK